MSKSKTHLAPKGPRKPTRKSRDVAPGSTAPTALAVASAAGPPTPRGKIGQVVALLRRDHGATMPDLMEATGWQAHSVRGAIAGAIKKKLGLPVISAKSDAGRVYRIEPSHDAG